MARKHCNHSSESLISRQKNREGKYLLTYRCNLCGRTRTEVHD